MGSVQENYICQASTFIENGEIEPDTGDTNSCVDLVTDHNESEQIRRKSVENVMSASHDVIGSSISQALAFTSAMTLPSNDSQQKNQQQPTDQQQQNQQPQSQQQPTQQQQQAQQQQQSPSSAGTSPPRLSTPTHPSPQPRVSISLNSPTSNQLDCDVSTHSSNESPLQNNFNRSISQRSSSGKDSICSSKEGVNDRKDCNNSAEKLDRSDGKIEKGEKKKKKSSWYSVLYPTYKSRSEDFRKIFKDVPDDERLVVDYSCALQKEILVHGRLYVSQNYLCFYANIFRWETLVCLRWKDVTSITKEKTALVIPNAILVYTQTEKMFFTSFGARDKTYLMLFRVWQNALMDKQMSQQEMWQWVHFCYGEELGLTSDDEDYIAPNNEDDKLTVGQRLAVESIIEDGTSDLSTNVLGLAASDGHMQHPVCGAELTIMPHLTTSRRMTPARTFTAMNTDVSDSTESDGEKTHPSSRGRNYGSKCDTPPVACTHTHEGRQIVKTLIPMHVDTVFTLLFTNSKFFVDFHDSRHTTDLMSTIWTENESTGQKFRTVTLTVALNASVGPKTSHVTETQVMSPNSIPGQIYAIDVESVNANIPYADSFYVTLHYCLTYVSDNETRFEVYAQVKYKKSVWGLVKGMIEKNCWAGLEEFYAALTKSLLSKSEDVTVNPSKRKTGRGTRRRTSALHPVELYSVPRGTIISTGGLIDAKPPANIVSHHTDYTAWLVFGVLVMLVFLNAMLYVKLWALEDDGALPYPPPIDLNSIKQPPKSHEEWLKLLQTQEKLHAKEMHKWHRVLKHTIDILRQAEESLSKLQLSIHPNQPSSIVSTLESVIAPLRSTPATAEPEIKNEF